ncbi:hypothetical protein OIV83_006297 [Microbotryomycetes sp. JL201]|nr:hypothetical protein OIV83_006297 [Microbotryomycetes sp. JL201]
MPRTTPSVASLLIALFAFAWHVNASIFTYKPVTADSFKAGNSWTVSWYADTGDHAKDTPLAKSFGQTSVGIYSGTSNKQVLRQHLGNLDPSKTTQLRIQVDPKIGPDGDDYFIRFESLSAKDSAGTPLLAFSGTFSLTGMTGTAASVASSPAIAQDDKASTAAAASGSASRAASSGIVKVVATSASSAAPNATGKSGNATGLATVSKAGAAAATASLAASKPNLNASSSAAAAGASKKPNSTSGASNVFGSNSQVWIGGAVAAAAAVAVLA